MVARRDGASSEVESLVDVEDEQNGSAILTASAGLGEEGIERQAARK